MKSSSDATRRQLLAATLAMPALALGWPAQAQSQQGRAAAPAVLDFDADTWQRLLREGPRPAAYVFTTTYCSTCPAVFDLLHAHIASTRRKVELAAVVMDVQGVRALAHAHHYHGATRIYAFNGFEPEIRQAVDRKWRNITPYVVLLDAQGCDQRVIGSPDATQLRRWLARGPALK